MFDGDWWSWGDEKLLPCVVLGDGSVVHAGQNEEPTVLDSCGADVFPAWEMVDNTVDWHAVQVAYATGTQLPPEHRSLMLDAEREFWALEDSIEALINAGGVWAGLACSGKLQEMGAWLLDVCYTHVAVQSRIQHTDVQ